MSSSTPGDRSWTWGLGGTIAKLRENARTGEPEPEGLQTRSWKRGWRLLFILAAAVLAWVPVIGVIWLLLRHRPG